MCDFIEKDEKNRRDAIALCTHCRANGQNTCYPLFVPKFERCGVCGKVFCNEQGDIEAHLCVKCSSKIIETGVSDQDLSFDKEKTKKCIIGNDAVWMSPAGEILNIHDMWVMLKDARVCAKVINILLTKK